MNQKISLEWKPLQTQLASTLAMEFQPQMKPAFSLQPVFVTPPSNPFPSSFSVDPLHWDRSIEHLKSQLEEISQKAWKQCRQLLTSEISRVSQIWATQYPLTVLQDIQTLYRQILKYCQPCQLVTDCLSCSQQAVLHLRRKYVKIDPLLLLLAAMLSQRIGQILSQHLWGTIRSCFLNCVSQIQDGLFLPLREINLLMQDSSTSTESIIAVEQLLTIRTEIAQTIYQQVSHQYQDYQSYSGSLAEPQVKAASLQDIEIFQLYLCWCVLAGSLEPIRRELFPICATLYPRLNISYQLVQDMLLNLLEQIRDRLSVENIKTFFPYLKILMEFPVYVL